MLKRKRVGIPIFAFLIAGVVVASYPFLTAELRRSNAEDLALEWAEAMYPKQTAGAICQGLDTDNDGYVSCTVKVGETRIPLDCYSYLSFAFGNTCREQKFQVKATVR